MQRYKEAILAVILIIVGFVYSVVTLRPQVSKIYHVEKDLGEKTVSLADLQRQLDEIKKQQQKKKDTSHLLKKIYKPNASGLDQESVFTVLFDDIIDMAKYNSIKIYSMEYTYNPADDEVVKEAQGKYSVCQLNMAIISDYPDLNSFLREIFKYPYLVNINKIEMAPYTKNKRILLSNLQLKLYAEK